MAEDAILDVAVIDDIVLDVFLGSGLTLLAAERTKRRCFGMELDPAYVDLAIRRWHPLKAVSRLQFGQIPLSALNRLCQLML